MKLAHAKLKFPKTLVLKSNLSLDNIFAGAEYQVSDVEIVNGKISFSHGQRNQKTYFRNVDAVKLGIDIVKE